MADGQQKSPERATFTRTERSREEAVLAVAGPLYDEIADEFQFHLDAAIAGGWPIITLDFKRVKVIASKAFGKIVFVMKRLQETRRTLRIRGCDPDLWNQFKATRFDRILDIEP